MADDSEILDEGMSPEAESELNDGRGDDDGEE